MMRQGLQAAVIGVTVGVAGAFDANRMIASLLFGVEPTDAATMAAVIATISTVAAVACWPPGWRASRLTRTWYSELTRSCRLVMFASGKGLSLSIWHPPSAMVTPGRARRALRTRTYLINPIRGR
jgi:hypothetical protein